MRINAPTKPKLAIVSAIAAKIIDCVNVLGFFAVAPIPADAIIPCGIADNPVNPTVKPAPKSIAALITLSAVLSANLKVPPSIPD